MKKWLRGIGPAKLAKYGAPLIRLYLRTIRLKIESPEHIIPKDRSIILAGLHRNGLAALHVLSHRSFLVMVSHSRDGELQAAIYSSLGFRVIRGGSSRGGDRATIEAIRHLRTENTGFVIAVDGPKGPPYIVKKGAVLMAKKTGAQIVPGGFCASRQKRFGSWDRFLLPLPFSTLYCMIGEPISVPQELDDRQFESIRKRLEDAILEQERRATIAAGKDPEFELC